MACSLICLTSTALWSEPAEASSLSAFSVASTIRQHCDLCRPPSAAEAAPPSTLEPYRRKAPPRPPGSRPHRLPKGRYKLVPHQKSAAAPSRGRLSGGPILIQPIYAIDGDTIRIGTDRIRLRGIDTPELNEPGGQAARLRLQQLLKEGPVRIVPHGQDVYGRTVADVLVDGRNVAEVLDEEGYAKPGS